MAGSLKEKIYSTILEQIMIGSIGLDEFLTEARLGEQFQASRAPVREALVALCNEGVLQNIPRVGYRLVTIGAKDVRDALAVRLLLESEAARLALKNMDPEKDQIVDQLIRDEEEADQRGLSIIEWMKNGEEVHLALARFAGNRILEELILELIRKLRRASTQVYVEHSRSRLKSSPYHLKILRALKRREEDELLANLAHDIALTNNLLGVPQLVPGSEA
ncbi:MAG: GntR family transcriptional regulator [Ancalomicrobiaceae bacterium]|nr:GntR family transcriptional regulator [Ancalomicrobiaceae bacterium]